MSWALRLGGAVLALAALSVLIFLATDVLPGDAAAVVAGPNPTPERLAAARTRLGLDQGPVTRYLDWAGGALRGELGTSFVGGRPVAEVLADRLPNSLLLTGLAYLVAVPTAVALGTLAGFAAHGHRRGVLDRVVSAVTVGTVGVPEFVLAVLLLAVLATGLGLVPEVGLVPVGGGPLDVPEILVLPVTTLAVLLAAYTTRLVRAGVVDALATPYAEAARLSGVDGWRLAVRHVLPNALGPAVQALTLAVGAVMGGSIVVESIFNYPGVGRELAAAVSTRDIPMIQGLALALSAVSLLALIAGDGLSRLLTPGAVR